MKWFQIFPNECNKLFFVDFDNEKRKNQEEEVNGGGWKFVKMERFGNIMDINNIKIIL
jgi:hypothetical protein